MVFLSFVRRVPPVLWVLVIGASVIAALVLLRPSPEPLPAKPLPQPKARVVVAEPQTLVLNVFAQGSVEPRRQIDLVAQVSGTLVEVAPQFVSGGYFAEAQTLVQIDPRDYQVALTRAQAALADAERVLAGERGLARQAERQWQELGSREANELFLRKPQLRAAQAQVEAAKAGVMQAQLNLERTRIALPFSARVSQTWVDLGQYLNSGSRIATVYDAGAARVRLPLTDLQVSLIDLPLALGKPEQALPEVILRGVVAGTPHEWRGKLTHAEASLDPQSRLFYGVVEIPDPFDLTKHKAPLLIGLYVQAEIRGKAIDQVLRLPNTVVFRRDQVFVLDAHNRVQQKTVKVLHRDDTQVWFQGDIRAGEQLVLERQGYLTLGTQVQPERVPEAPEVSLP